jgi:nitrogen regulatory protein P-II 1
MGGVCMKKLEIITRPEKLEDIKELVNSSETIGMTVSMVSGCGLQKGKKEIYRGTEVMINLLPKVKIEIVIPNDKLDDMVDKISKTVRTGEIGDGKIFIYNVEDALRIRTGEKGETAI